jgi:hypothetical protein
MTIPAGAHNVNKKTLENKILLHIIAAKKRGSQRKRRYLSEIMTIN